MAEPMPALETAPTEQRSRTMRAIKSTGTLPELALVAALAAVGVFPDERNDRLLPGSPDLVFLSGLCVFVDSAFWHGRGRTPKTNTNWWREKLRRNRERDARADRLLRESGWAVMRLDAEFCRRRAELAAEIVEAKLWRVVWRRRG